MHYETTLQPADNALARVATRSRAIFMLVVIMALACIVSAQPAWADDAVVTRMHIDGATSKVFSSQGASTGAWIDFEGTNVDALTADDFVVEEQAANGTWGPTSIRKMFYNYPSMHSIALFIPANNDANNKMYRVVALRASAETAGNPFVITVSGTGQEDGFSASITQAQWNEGKILVTFDKPVELTEDAASKMQYERAGSAIAIPSTDIVSQVSDTVIAIQSASGFQSTYHGVIFKEGSLKMKDTDIVNNFELVSPWPEVVKRITDVSYSPEVLGPEGGEVVASLQGSDLNTNGFPMAMLYLGDALVNQISRTGYNDVAQTFTFSLPANAGTADKVYSLKFMRDEFSGKDIEIVPEQGADKTITVQGRATALIPEVTSIDYSAIEFKAEGGDVEISLTGKALTQLSVDDMSLVCDGSDAGLQITYEANTDTAATVRFTLPENTSTKDDVTYTFSITKGADNVAGNPQDIVVKAINDKALVEGIDYIDRNMNPYHHGAGDYTLFYTGGTIKALISGDNLNMLSTDDFTLEVKGDDGQYSAIDGQVRIEQMGNGQALVTFAIPQNDSIISAAYYRFSVAKTAPSVANSTQEFTVDRREEQLGDTKFRIEPPNWGASIADEGLIRIWVREPTVELNPKFADGTWDVSDYIFFSNQNNEPYTTVRELSDNDEVYMENGDIFIKLADTSTEIPFYVVFKGESLVSGDKVLATRDSFTHLYHNRYINQGAHIESIEYDQITYTQEGGHVHAVIHGTQITQSYPGLWGKVFVDSEKDYSTTIVPTIEVAEDGLTATVDFDVPANNTDRTISYRFIPVINDTNVPPTYIHGYDVVSVLPEGGKTSDVTLSSIELQGDGDLDDRLDVLETSTSQEKFTSKIYATIRGTNLSSKNTVIKAVDENGVVWPTLPVFECGATIRWQSSATYMPEKESINEQVIELLPPRRLGVPHTFTLYFAPDGENFLDEPVGTVILDNQGLFDYEDMALRRFVESDLTDLRTVTIKYVDEAGKELAKADTLKGYGITEMYHQPIAAKDIDGYTLKSTSPNNLDIMMSQPVIHTTGEYIFENGQYFFRDLTKTHNNSIVEDYTIIFTYAKDVDKTALEASIKAAESTSKGVKTSETGSDVDPKDTYVTPVVAQQLADALKNAKSVFNNPSATQAQVDAAKKRLDTQKANYDKAKKPGKKAAPVTTKAALKSATAPAQKYTGKALKPAVTVKDANGKVVPASAYTVTYANNVNPGTATATVKAKANSKYTGSVKATFKITAAEQGVYWLVNKKTGENLYTTAVKEVNTLSKVKKTWINKGIMWYAPTTGEPIYRLFNPKTGDHHFTKSANEVRVLTKVKKTWKTDFDGKPIFYSGGAKKIWRQYSDARQKAGKPGTHKFTTTNAKLSGWKNEGALIDALRYGKVNGIK